MRRKPLITVGLLLLTLIGDVLVNQVAGAIGISLWISLPLLALVTVILLAITLWEYNHGMRTGHALSRERYNRAQMIKNVQAFWINGENSVLKKASREAPLIALQLSILPDFTTLRQSQRDPSSLVQSVASDITQVYDREGGHLLILGAPGSGKTTLLLQLASSLLDRATQQEDHPIPVVFLLSSWAVKRNPLDAWLVEELRTQYKIPPLIAQEWVAKNQILPLLDGLDEVDEPFRAPCINAINAYVHGLLPTVVCCRRSDYPAETTPIPILPLTKTIEVQPLTPKQINDYLSRPESTFAAVRDALQKYPALKKIAGTPLMLTVLTTAYRDILPDPLKTSASPKGKTSASPKGKTSASPKGKTSASPKDWPKRVFETYVQNRLSETQPNKLKQTVHSLACLARYLKRQRQTIFYIEHLQPDWIEDHRLRAIYENTAMRLPGGLIGILVSLIVNTLLLGSSDFISLIIYGLIGGLMGKLFGERGQSSPLHNALLIGCGTALSVWLRTGLFYGLNDWLDAARISAVSFVLSSVLLFFVFLFENKAKSQAGHLNALLVGMCIGLSFALGDGLTYGLSDGLTYGVRDILSVGPVFGLIGVLLNVILGSMPRAIEPSEIIVWSWRGLRKNLFDTNYLKNVLRVGLSIGLGIGLSFGASTALSDWLGGRGFGWITGLSVGSSVGLSDGLTYGLFVGLIYWLFAGLFNGLSSDRLDEESRNTPNAGIRRSARNSLVVGLMSGVVSGLISVSSVILYFGLRTGLSYGLHYIPRYGLVTSLSIGLHTGLSNAMGIGESVGLRVGLEVGLATSLLFALLFGGIACLQHYILRLVLWRRGSLPWKLPQFLDYAAARILLRKVGGGYIFFHPLLLDYFAELDN